MNERISKAYEFSQEKHGTQVRKFSNQSYFSHPKEVANIIENLTKDEDLIIVALLHDTIEDTSATYDEIKNLFGKKIADLVLELTSNDKNAIKKYGKSLYLGMKMSEMSQEALVVKLADRLHNIKNLENDNIPFEFIEKYYRETWTILDMIKYEENYYECKELDYIRDLLIERIEVILKFLEVRYGL